ncbi:DUF302 domain-containing protein [Sphingomicrobium lutaoense]|uniref:Uncharacterized protein (DUF302 family) n=1 Tax=Sphingomicrobium lutaoense TaxID=515949 RepID=A0A839Z5N9_9SPHN|nr:DUF302 domain-containing protein [Sphingomicrobium lutaoense]MBB3764932.1 uncharacterized protein (DUF302 family) [Sphingomicrobium lutaoense]
MSYYFARQIEGMDMAKVEERAREALSSAGFGILTEADVSATLKEKIGVEFRPYKILGACNPALAHEALKVEDKIGTMLPCNLILQKLDDGRIEVAAIDPVASMRAIDNPDVRQVAEQVAGKLKGVIEAI